MNQLERDNEFLELWETYGSAARISEALKCNVRGVHERRAAVEERTGIRLVGRFHTASRFARNKLPSYTRRLDLGILNGIVIVFSDAHYWPGLRSTAHKGLLWFIQEMKPKAVINNGDAFDGASISRFPRIGWDSTPSVKEELDACSESLGEIEYTARAARDNVALAWNLGNHDARFETRLAANAPQYEYVGGFALKDHFPAWKPAWSTWNNDNTIMKHRYKGGIHATHNNTVNAGVNIITGHLHSLKVTPFTDYNGDRYGVDTGFLADVDGPQFQNYLEDSPVNWRSGFVVLNFWDGVLLQPETVKVFGPDLVEFRGDVINVAGM